VLMLRLILDDDANSWDPNIKRNAVVGVFCYCCIILDFYFYVHFVGHM